MPLDPPPPLELWSHLVAVYRNPHLRADSNTRFVVRIFILSDSNFFHSQKHCIKYLTAAIDGLSVSLCVKSVRNQHIYLQKKCETFVKIRNSMTFPWLLAKFSFSMTFPGLNLFFSFSMVFHDFPWPWEPWISIVKRNFVLLDIIILWK